MDVWDEVAKDEDAFYAKMCAEQEEWYNSEECQLQLELGSLMRYLETDEENHEYVWLSKAPSLMNHEDRTPDALMLNRVSWIHSKLDELKAEKVQH